MELNILGWEKYAQKLTEKVAIENIARVAVENKSGYLLYAQEGELEGLVRGKFRQAAKQAADFPKVGDWVLIEKLVGENKAIIKEVLPRFSKLSRKKAGEDIEEQIIAVNVDVVFIMQGLDGDFNLKRLQRYVTMAKEGSCKPVILLNKNDAVDDAEQKLQTAHDTLPGVKIFSISAKERRGLDEVRALINAQSTVVFVGSSGVGKSTLVNTLLGNEKQTTGEVRADDSRGKHTTTKRELLILPSGGIIIDTPGMRELGLWALDDAVTETFEDIEKLIQHCRFRDCDHDQSAGCAVKLAVDECKINKGHYENFLRLRGELDHVAARKAKKKYISQMRKMHKIKKRI